MYNIVPRCIYTTTCTCTCAFTCDILTSEGILNKEYGFRALIGIRSTMLGTEWYNCINKSLLEVKLKGKKER